MNMPEKSIDHALVRGRPVRIVCGGRQDKTLQLHRFVREQRHIRIQIVVVEDLVSPGIRDQRLHDVGSHDRKCR